MRSTIMVSMMVFYCAFFSCSSAISYADYLRRLNTETLEYKHARCFHPQPYHAMSLNDRKEIEGQIVQRWFYHAPTKACRPLYSPPGYIFTVDDNNYDLPRTQYECEVLCADDCVAEFESGNLEVGVCTSLDIPLPERCKGVLPEAHPKQCPFKYSKCCPRDFERRAFVVEELI